MEKNKQEVTKVVSPVKNGVKSTKCILNKVREKSRECHNHKPQSFPDTKRRFETCRSNLVSRFYY